MTAQIIDGRKIADRLLARVAVRVEQRLAEGLSRPGLAVILVGEDPASAVYVANKRRACVRAGIKAFDYNLPASISEAALLGLIRKLNGLAEVDGILVQLPLPGAINTQSVIEAIDPSRDVDGFHAENLGRLLLRWPGLRPCTPRGVMTLLAHIDVPIRGQRAVVVGASNHVGRPLAMELMIAGATVTVCHRFTTDLAAEVARADLVAVAVGKPGLIRASWIKPGAVVIDVGINRLADGSLVGDVEPEACERAGYLTPVPGGVGPMTVATLMVNVLEAAEQRINPAALT